MSILGLFSGNKDNHNSQMALEGIERFSEEVITIDNIDNFAEIILSRSRFRDIFLIHFDKMKDSSLISSSIGRHYDSIEEFQLAMRQKEVFFVFVGTGIHSIPQFLEGISLNIERPFSLHGRNLYYYSRKLETALRGLHFDISEVTEQALMEIVRVLMRQYGFREDDSRPPMLFERFDGIYSYRGRDPFGAVYTEKWIVEVRNDNDISDSRALSRLFSISYSSKESYNVIYFTNTIINSRVDNILSNFRKEISQKIKIVDRYEIKLLISKKERLVELVGMILG